MQTKTFRAGEIATTKTRVTTSPTVPSPFKWLRDLNAAFIACFKFKDLSADRLADMGITRQQQNDAFLRQFAPRDGR